MAILTHLRWISAALVAISHFRNLLMQDFHGGPLLERGFYFITGFGHSAVIVFFVLSGFLVGGKIRRMAGEQRPDLRRYAVDRFSRIFVVAWPAIVWSFLVLQLILAFAPDAPFVSAPGWSSALPSGLDGTPSHWIALAALMNELLARTPAINGPLWSLACEWSYYMVAGAGLALYRRRWTWLIPYAVVLVGLAASRSPMMVVGGGVWLFGLLASFVSDRTWLNDRWTLALVIAASGITFVGSRLFVVPDLLLGAAIAALIAHGFWRTWSWGGQPGERMASYSYTLYATHFPLAVLFAAGMHLQQRLPYGPKAVAIVTGSFLVALVFAKLFAMITEDRTAAVRNGLLSITTARPAVLAE